MKEDKPSYEPMGANITVHAPNLAKKTAGGIIKSKEMLAEERKKLGEALLVAHIGPDVRQIKPGDKIILRNEALVSEINIKGAVFLQVDSYAVLGILRI